MVNKVYIVWCKLNKTTDKFDLGIFIDKQKATDTVETSHSIDSIGSKVWIQEYKLSN